MNFRPATDGQVVKEFQSSGKVVNGVQSGVDGKAVEAFHGMVKW